MVYPTKPGVKTHTADRTNGGSGHLILKIDIEGGEYGVLRESLESGMLCDYAKRGNRVDLVVEFHKWVIEDKKVSILDRVANGLYFSSDLMYVPQSRYTFNVE